MLSADGIDCPGVAHRENGEGENLFSVPLSFAEIPDLFRIHIQSFKEGVQGKGDFSCSKSDFTRVQCFETDKFWILQRGGEFNIYDDYFVLSTCRSDDLVIVQAKKNFASIKSYAKTNYPRV